MVCRSGHQVGCTEARGRGARLRRVGGIIVHHGPLLDKGDVAGIGAGGNHRDAQHLVTTGGSGADNVVADLVQDHALVAQRIGQAAGHIGAPGSAQGIADGIVISDIVIVAVLEVVLAEAGVEQARKGRRPGGIDTIGIVGGQRRCAHRIATDARAVILQPERIADVGESLQIIKHDEVVAKGWHDSKFAVAPNETLEVGTRRLLHYRRRQPADHIPGELHDAHSLIADELEGVIDTLIRLERELNIEMFHGDEVNEEAILFANWAYKLIHDTIVPIRFKIAISPLSWLLNLPYAVEILAQTKADATSWTEASNTCIYYNDWETHTIRRSFTCQFHPELMADIRDVGKRDGPRYAELKDNDGVRLLIRLLYHGIQE